MILLQQRNNFQLCKVGCESCRQNMFLILIGTQHAWIVDNWQIYNWKPLWANDSTSLEVPVGNVV